MEAVQDKLIWVLENADAVRFDGADGGWVSEEVPPVPMGFNATSFFVHSAPTEKLA